MIYNSYNKNVQSSSDLQTKNSGGYNIWQHPIFKVINPTSKVCRFHSACYEDSSSLFSHQKQNISPSYQLLLQNCQLVLKQLEKLAVISEFMYKTVFMTWLSVYLLKCNRKIFSFHLHQPCKQILNISNKPRMGEFVMALRRLSQFRRLEYEEGSRPDMRTLRRWNSSGEIPGGLIDAGGRHCTGWIWMCITPKPRSSTWITQF